MTRSFARRAALVLPLCLSVAVVSSEAQADQALKEGLNGMSAVKVRLTLGDGETATASMTTGAAARDFVALLPLRLRLTDYHATEKISDLPKRLSIDGEPDGFKPEPGDIAFYAPWGNLAIFYKGFTHSPGLVLLGRLDRVPDALRKPVPIEVTIERVD